MSKLSAFLSQNAIKVENAKFVVSKRFLDENNKPIEWEICAIKPTEDDALRKEATRRVQVPGKRNQYVPETNYPLYLGKLAVKCTVFPNLHDAELQTSYGVMDAENLLKTMLTPGEYADYVAKVQEVNGFEVSLGDMVEEAKN